MAQVGACSCTFGQSPREAASPIGCPASSASRRAKQRSHPAAVSAAWSRSVKAWVNTSRQPSDSARNSKRNVPSFQERTSRCGGSLWLTWSWPGNQCCSSPGSVRARHTPLDRVLVATLEPQHWAVVEREAAKVQVRDEFTAGRRVQPKACGVALVSLPDRVVSDLCRQVLACQVRPEPVEVALPPGRSMGGDRPVVEDMGERQRASVSPGAQVEPEHLPGEGPFDQMRWLQFGHLPGLSTRLEHLTGLGRPAGGGGKPAFELGRYDDGTPYPLHRMPQLTLKPQCSPSVDGF